jgi:hypothetical protein
MSNFFMSARIDQDHNHDVEILMSARIDQDHNQLENLDIDLCEIGYKLSCIYTQVIDSF